MLFRSVTHEELARRIGRSRPHISNTIRLLSLPPAVQKRVAAGVLTAGHARALLAVDDAVAQEELARRIVAEGLSVRAVEEIVALGARPAQKARQPGAKAPVAPALRDLADRLSDALPATTAGRAAGNQPRMTLPVRPRFTRRSP